MISMRILAQHWPLNAVQRIPPCHRGRGVQLNAQQRSQRFFLAFPRFNRYPKRFRPSAFGSSISVFFRAFLDSSLYGRSIPAHRSPALPAARRQTTGDLHPPPTRPCGVGACCAGAGVRGSRSIPLGLNALSMMSMCFQSLRMFHSHSCPFMVTIDAFTSPMQPEAPWWPVHAQR